MRITVTKTGETPRTFEGKPLGEWSSKARFGEDKYIRFHVVKAYQSKKGMIVAIEYHTTCTNEFPHSDYFILGDRSISEVLSQYDPIAHLVGYPDHDRFAEKQSILEDRVKGCWLWLCSQVYEGLGVESELFGPEN
jgi:hypothetical protein